MMLASIGAGFKLEVGAGVSFIRILRVRPGMLGKINTAYRSYARQAELYADWLRYKAGGPWAPFALPPGTSQHNLGLALDIDSNPPNGDHAWMVTHGREYGWHRTNAAEPWHFEYVAANDQHRHNQGADMAIDSNDIKAIWAYPVNRSGGEVRAIQELADAKTQGIQANANTKAILAALAKLSTPAPATIDYAKLAAAMPKPAAINYAALAKAVNDDAHARMKE